MKTFLAELATQFLIGCCMGLALGAALFVGVLS
jgi:hypothetical protein